MRKLLALLRADEHAAEAYAEAARRDQAGKAAGHVSSIRAEWYDAAYAQYLAARACAAGTC